MRNVSAACVFLVLVAACSAPAEQEPAGPDEMVERAAVERALTEWQTGVGQGDTAAVARFLAPTFQILQDSVWYDRDGFLEAVASLPDLFGGPYEITYTFSDWRTTVRGDVAWTSVRNHAEVVPHNADPFSLDWRETAVLRKEGSTWLIDRYHSASDCSWMGSDASVAEATGRSWKG